MTLRRNLLWLLVTGAAFGQSFTAEVPGTAGFRWVNTGRYLAPNTSVRLQANGVVNYGRSGSYDAHGTTSLGYALGFPSPGPQKYNLVARITTSSTNPDDELREMDQPYTENTFCARRGGNLWLTANDDQPSDNSGAYTVQVTLGTCGADAPLPVVPQAVSDLRVRGMEVTQGTQAYPANDVPLIGYKRTVVRVYVQVTGDAVWSDVTGRLTVRNISGTHLGGEIRGRFLLPSTADPRSAVRVGPSGSSRDVLTDSLNFVLDLDQTAPGVRELEVQVSSISGRLETDATNNRLVQRVTFKPSVISTIYGTTYGNLNSSPTCHYIDADNVTVPFSHFEEHRKWVENVYPVSQFFIVPMPGVPADHLFDNSTCNAYNDAHSWTARHLARLRPEGGARAYLMGPLPRYGYDGWCCTGDAGNQVARGSDTWFDPGPTLAHEIGHSWGRPHTFEDSMFPYAGNSYGGNVGLRTNAGLFASWLQALPGRAADGTILRGDFMSYTPWFWVSPYTYCALMRAITGGSIGCDAEASVGTLSAPMHSMFAIHRGRDAAFASTDAVQLLSATAGGYPYLYIAGHSGGVNKPDFEPFEMLYLSRELPLSSEKAAEEYRIALAGVGGKVLAEYPAVGGPNYYNDDAPRFGTFIPWRSDAKAILLLHNGEVVLSRAVSANSPVVKLDSVPAGKQISGKQEIRWSASDADGDDLMFSVDYSRDGGKTWIPVASGVRRNSTTVDFDRLAGASMGLLRVSATDGVNTTEAVMNDAFSVASKPPVIESNFGAQKEIFMKSTDTLTLSATAFDWEDGPISDPSAYRWTLGQKQVGTGAWMNLSAIAPGTYDLKLAVVDSDANVSEARTTLVVTK